MNETRKERLQMGGWASGRNGDAICYQSVEWSAEERKVYRAAYNHGLTMFRLLGK